MITAPSSSWGGSWTRRSPGARSTWDTMVIFGSEVSPGESYKWSESQPDWPWSCCFPPSLPSGILWRLLSLHIGWVNMVLCKNEVHIPLKRWISHRFDTPLAILQVEVDRDDYSTKLIMVRVWDKEKPWSPFYLSCNRDYQVRGQPWGKLQVIWVK